MSRGGILNILRRLFTYRRQKRFTAQCDTLVIVSPGTEQEQKVQLLDISQGGMAFIYEGSPEDIKKSGILKILAERPYLANFDYDTVSDAPISGDRCVQSSAPYRRRGVKFKWLGNVKEMELRDYIKKVSINLE